MVQMPKSCRAVYQKAMTGSSRKAAMQAFCQECMGWVVTEVYVCTDAGCPLYPYRPASRASQSNRESYVDGVESTNAAPSDSHRKGVRDERF